MYLLSIFRATGGTYYFRLIRISDGYIWNVQTGKYAIDTSWADSAVSMTEREVNLGQYPINLPANIDAAKHDLVTYVQAGGSPATSDEIDLGMEIAGVTGQHGI